mgnify:FL=1|tara:strand:+ start:7153 stop:7440 length:288 start_codon:yes stop_codon:yes gene_type:complete
MSYALNRPIYASGKAALTIDAGGSLNSVTVSLAGINKTTDIVVITLDYNGQTDVVIDGLPYIYAITDGANFGVGLGLSNTSAVEVTCFLNWVVVR